MINSIERCLKLNELYTERFPVKWMLFSNLVVWYAMINEEEKSLALSKSLGELLSPRNQAKSKLNKNDSQEEIIASSLSTFIEHDVLVSIKCLNQTVIMLRKMKIDSILNQTVFECRSENFHIFDKLIKKIQWAVRLLNKENSQLHKTCVDLKQRNLAGKVAII